MKITKNELRTIIKEELKSLTEANDLFLKIRNEFPSPPRGADLRDLNGNAQVYYYGQNKQAKTWADNVRKKYPTGVQYIDTAKMSAKDEKEWKADNKRYLSGKQ